MLIILSALKKIIFLVDVCLGSLSSMKLCIIWLLSWKGFLPHKFLSHKHEATASSDILHGSNPWSLSFWNILLIPGGLLWKL